MSWGNKNSSYYDPSFPLLKDKELDIKFEVFIHDHNFKFMPFDIVVNGVDIFLVLPVSLLDMGHPRPLTCA